MNKMKRLKYGSYAAMMAIMAIAVFIIVTLIVGSQDIKIDATKNKIYSLSDQTKKVLAGINENVNIYVFYLKGREDFNVNQLLQNYKKLNRKINLQILDIDRNPEKVKKYSDVVLDDSMQGPVVSVVFESGKRVKVVNTYEMYQQDYQSEQKIFMGETKFTNAIRHITIGKVPTVYFIQGHNEATNEDIPLAVEFLRMENYEIKTLNLLTQKGVPEDADIVLDISPRTAFLPEEIQMLEKYFNNGGKGAFYVDITVKPNEDTTAIRAMIGKWGVNIGKALVAEGNLNQYASGNHAVLIPEMLDHEITNPIKNNQMNIVIGYAADLKLNQTAGYDVKALLKTSKNSWGKTNYNAPIEKKEAGDLTGPIDLMAAITHKTNGKEMRVVVAGSSSLLSNKFLQNGGNGNLFLNSIGWLRGASDEISIRPKQTPVSVLNMKNSQRIAINTAVLIVIPGLVFGAGIVVWMRRRHL